MARSAAIVIEVGSGTPSDNNGGGFKAGATGTDKSFGGSQAALQRTDLVVDATTNTQVTSAAHAFDSTDVGNLLQVTSGASWTTGFYEITAVTGVKATLDSSPAATSVTGGTGTVGGALATMSKGLGAMVAGNFLWAKTSGGPYTSNALTTTAGATNGAACFIKGYNSTRGDLDDLTTYTNYPILQNSSASLGISLSAFNHLENFIVDCNNTGTTGVTANAGQVILKNIQVKQFATTGIASNNSGTKYVGCQATLGKAASTSGFSMTGGGQTAFGCTAIANPCPGFSITQTVSLVDCNASGNTGASSDGFAITGTVTGTALVNCTAEGNGRDGLRFSSTGVENSLVWNGLWANNAGYGINANGTAYTYANANYNAFWNNTLGAVNQFPVGSKDITLSASPFVNTSGSDWSLNSTAGGGAAVRGTGYPQTLAGTSTPSRPDIGAAQHADTPSTVSIMLEG